MAGVIGAAATATIYDRPLRALGRRQRSTIRRRHGRRQRRSLRLPARRSVTAAVRSSCSSPGPVTLGLALVHAGAPADIAFAAASPRCVSGLRRSSRSPPSRRPERAARRVPRRARPRRARHPGFPLRRERHRPALWRARRARTGPHRRPLLRPHRLALVSAPGPTSCRCRSARPRAVTAPLLAAHLERGGWIAWGAVPDHRAARRRAEPLWRRLGDAVVRARRGRRCDAGRLRRQALVTPACGLAGHGEARPRPVLRLAAAVGGRVLRPGRRRPPRHRRVRPRRSPGRAARPRRHGRPSCATRSSTTTGATTSSTTPRSPTPSTTRSSASCARSRSAHPELRHARLADADASAAPPSALFAPVQHRVPMMSLDNAFSFDELVAWGKRMERCIGRATSTTCAS